MSSGKVFLGVLVGMTAGAVLGILFAPDKGSATRARIVEKSEDYAEVVKEKFNQMVDSINEKFERVANDVERNVSKAKGAKKDIESAMI
jgi:gas vesicle protein